MAPKEGRKGAPVKRVTDDSRFAHVQNDPRFIRPKKADTKVKVDKRFSHMIKDKDFTETTKVDRYGREHEDNRAEAYLRNAYEFSGSESGSGDSEGEEEDSEDESESGEDVVDRARGRGVESEDSSDSEFDSEISDVEWGAGEVSEPEEPEDVPRGDETRRFACVNMDWEHVRAVDLLTVFSAFKPDGGSVVAVKIYPSEFGKERMSKEATEGPPRDIFAKPSKPSDSDDEEDEGEDDLVKEQLDDNEEFDQVALRKYEVEKMRYYFGVVECNSVATAQAIYKQCDGTEYEASANFFDLRFVPDDMDFDDTPKDEAMHVPEKYEPLDFASQALQHSRVKLTWDADEPTRMKMTRRAFTQDEIDSMDFGNLLASSSGESSSDEEDLAKKRALLLSGANDSDSDEESEAGEMEITFTPGLSQTASRLENKKRAEEEEEAQRANENTIERFRRLKKERREKWKESKKGPAKSTKNEDDLISDNEIDSRTGGDNFFTYSDDDLKPSAAKPRGKKDVRESKTERKQRQEAEAKQRAELELLVDSKERGHFDMAEIVKAEKAKGRKGKRAEKVVEDDFKLNTSDPRFGALF
ncbi:pre-rRNA-processing protein esf1, partial [Coemansia sp. 'formosensis']